MYMEKDEQYELVFDQFDVNKDGKISALELQQCVGAIGNCEITVSEEAVAMELLDGDRDVVCQAPASMMKRRRLVPPEPTPKNPPRPPHVHDATGKAITPKGEGSVLIDMKSVVTELTEKLNTNLNMPLECCIFRTPEILSRHNKNAYIPNAFAIGPLHHGRTSEIEATEKIKLKYLDGILNRSSKEKLQELIDVVSQVEEKARKCYACHVESDPGKFLQMLVVDGCFIIELFRKDADEKLYESDDPISTISILFENLCHDLILLENQIPWFVLEKLFDLTKIGDEKVPLDHLTLQFFGNIFTSGDPNTNELPWNKIRREGTKHILDLLRNFLISGYKENSNQTTYDWISLPSATTLSQLGAEFKPVSGMSMLDVQFNNGCLEIPSILLQETTEIIFRNLVSLEQCVPNYRPRITSYVKLMANLIDTKEDIKVLHRNKIVDIWVSFEEATKIFDQLYTDTYLKEFHYSVLCERVDAFRKNQIPKARYQLIHNYCFNPWATCGTIVVIIIFFLTILQTVCDVKQAWIK